MAKIISVNGDTDTLQLIEIALENEGHTVLSFGDGKEAFEAALKELPDLVILDVTTPETNCQEAFKKIKETLSMHLLPIIILTEQLCMKDKLRALKLGADDYITKPFNPYELAARVEGIINRHRETRAMNPLTGLPGNVSIEKEITKRIKSGEKFGVLWIDLDNFKSYNDNYGFEKGDVIIKATSNFIMEAVKKSGTSADMIGHLGGDDFIVVTTPECSENICRDMIQIFDERIPGFYLPEDKVRGYITSKDRQGNVQMFPIMSVSTGIVTNEQRNFTHYAELAKIAAEVKSVAKEIPKSSYFRDKRKY